MIRTIIADDEPLARQILRDLIALESDFDLIGEASDGEKALKLIDSERPDVAILDIDMPGPGGLEIVGRLNHMPLVVFATAYDSHAVAAFDLQAIDYLLKPFGRRRFRRAADRIRGAVEHSRSSNRVSLEEALSGQMTRIMVRERGRIIPVPVATIHHIEAMDDYVKLHTREGEHLASVRMTYLEAHLDPAQFVRVHRSHILNLSAISEIRRMEGGNAIALIRKGRSIPISRSRYRQLRSHRGFR